ncbi:hypothetical protein GQ55_9G439400 [Panicum hallii var. hallii]|uniref:Uncharacterized protein n=1 Tax=Panicum hallii var. hallii TaxID=1504633 RepID=A0A2T7CBB8_9POAL|nr:hypothetical protein GQ55_9G439400 [Panicum hallii var. hallii]
MPPPGHCCSDVVAAGHCCCTCIGRGMECAWTGRLHQVQDSRGSLIRPAGAACTHLTIIPVQKLLPS